MAFSSTILVLFSLATASTIAHGQLPSPVAQVIVVGRLFCTIDGNPVDAILDQLVAGANVTVSCNGREASLGQVLTDSAGSYQVVLSTLDALLFGASNCVVRIILPSTNCTALPPTGTLQAPISLFSIALGALGYVVTFAAGLYEIVSGA